MKRYHKLLEKQIKKHLPKDCKNDPGILDFLNSVNESYQANERDRELINHAFKISESEYQEVNNNLLKEYELKKRSVEKLKQAVKKIDLSIDIKVGEKDDDLLVIADYLNEQIIGRKGIERELSRTVNLLETLLTNLHSGILVEDENRKILYTNDQFCALFNIPVDPESLRGADCSQSAEQSKILFKDPHGFLTGVNKALQERKPVISEELALADGRYLERDFIPIFIHNNYKGHLWHYKNITDRKQNENNLRYLNNMQEAILNGTNYAIIFTDAVGTIKTFNKGAEKMLGYKAEEMIDKQNPSLFHLSDEIRIRAEELSGELVEKVEPGFEVFVTYPRRDIAERREWTYIRSNGQRFPVSLTICSIKNSVGEITGFLGIARDISEQKQAQEALKISEEKYKNIIEKSTDIIYKINKHGFFTFVNPVGVRITGFSARELYHKHYSDLIHEDYRKRAIVFYRDQVETKKPTTYFEFPIVTKSAQEKWIGQSVQYTPLPDNDFELTVLAIDITERKIHERSIFLQEKKYRNIIDNMNLGLVEVDKQELIKFCNQGFCELSGYTKEELLGKNIIELIVPETLKNTIGHKTPQRLNGISDIYEIQVKNKKGELKWWMISGAPNYDEAGKLIGSIGIHLDVTERKTLEHELEISKQKAEESSKAKEAFLANMSHEIRTPLNAIIGMIRELSLENLTSNQRVYLDNTSTASQHLDSVLNNILDISKIEAGEFQLDLQNFNLNAILKEVISIMGNKASEKNLYLKLSVAPGVKKMFAGDPVRLKQILINLIGNSIKFTNTGGITIKCDLLNESKTEQKLQISIVDTGIGMDQTYVKNIFNKFSQEDISTSRKYGGTGLGMAISQELIHLMQGSIDVESSKNKGTTIKFNITLPIGDEKGIKAQEVIRMNPTGKKIKILLAEDNEFNRLVAIKTLNRHDCIVSEAVNGADAVDLVKKENFDVILMDLQMPVMDGLEATRIIRNVLHNTTPIIALTANAFKNEIDLCMKIGMNGYVTKPYEEKLLIDTVYKNIVSEKPQPMNIAAKTTKGLYDLTMLRGLCQGDSEQFAKMIFIFIKQSKDAITDFNTAIESKNTQQIYQIAHRIKPSIDGLGIVSLKNEILELERSAKAGLYSENLITSLHYTQKVLRKVIDNLEKENLS